MIIVFSLSRICCQYCSCFLYQVFFGGVKLVLALTLAFAVLDESVAQNSISKFAQEP